MGKSLKCRAETRRTRALSAARANVQSWAGRSGVAMVLGLLLTGAGAVDNTPPPFGELSTARRGDYVCEMPGDAMGLAGIHVPGEDFTILHASSYAADGQYGTYLLAGDTLTMTSGPRKGARYHRVSDNFLRKLAQDGSETALRCIRSVLNNRKG